MKRPGKWFTLVFEGDIVAFPSNPLKADTVFGIPYAVRSSDALEELDRITAERDRMRKALEQAQKVLAMIVDPKTIRATSVDHAYAHAVEAEASARAALTPSVPDADRS